MLKSCRAVAALLVGIAVAAPAVVAQSAQPFSVAASLLAASQEIGDKSISGFGFEGQLRYTPPSLWSLGGGVQYSHHPSGGDKIDIVGVFLEPRYAVDIGSDKIAPYLAGRLAFLHESMTLASVPGADFSSGGVAYGAGAGVLIKATGRVNIDIGAAFVRQSFSNATDGSSTATFPAFTGYVAKGGLSFGFGS